MKVFGDPLASFLFQRQGQYVVLVRDACHVTTPFAGQSAAMVVEDTNVLAKVPDGHASVERLPRLIELCQKVRRPRAEEVQGLAAAYGRSWASKYSEHAKSRNAHRSNCNLW